jgi:nucleoside phosphorylase
MNIGLIMAMKDEAAPIIKALDFKPIEQNWPYSFQVYQSNKGKNSLTLFLAGTDHQYQVESVGSPSCALLAHLALTQFPIEFLINAGTAGGLESQGTQIGDVFLCHDKTYFHDRIIPLPGYIEYGEGHYPLWNSDHMAKDLGLRQNIVSTGNCLNLYPEQKEIMQKFNVGVKEMEAAAIAYVAGHFKVPLLPDKSITDLIDHPVETADQFLSNLHQATTQLEKQLARVLDWLEQNPI